MDIPKLRTICRGAVLYRRVMIRQHPSVGEDDLLQIAMIRAVDAHNSYKPPFNYASHIHRAADRAILSVLRALNGVGKPRPKTFGLSDDTYNISDCVNYTQIQNT